MKAEGLAGTALSLIAVASGSAMFNLGTLRCSRTVTMGKELVDLKDAPDKGAFTQDECAKAKKDVLAGGLVTFEPSCSAKK